MTSEQLPPGVDPDVPSTARMYDYYLGGKNNYRVDRERAEQVIAAFPGAREAARANRAFLGAAVRTMARNGVDQFVDLGAGLPTQGHVHEVARPLQSGTRVVYVDIDPVACAHARALLPDDATAVVHADIRRPADVLDDPQVARLIDWDRPVGLLLISVLHFIDDADDPAGIIGAFTGRMASGSHLALTVASGTDAPADTERMADAYKGSGTGVGGLRDQARIEAFFAGFPLLAPGLVEVRDWPDAPASPRPAAGPVRLLAGVGRRP
ncbi:SAM-dependent methyltransferase [Actinomadura atramentaria]|uniref:SAM-dependent methyltransferase n=1 Tax=Actinomadura atramentaria TaxID=1990 RepID=UPI0003A33CFA|nr:SAM-dependent methyltransferase [Actinomadura atramentaria]